MNTQRKTIERLIADELLESQEFDIVTDEEGVVTRRVSSQLGTEETCTDTLLIVRYDCYEQEEIGIAFDVRVPLWEVHADGTYQEL